MQLRCVAIAARSRGDGQLNLSSENIFRDSVKEECKNSSVSCSKDTGKQLKLRINLHSDMQWPERCWVC